MKNLKIIVFCIFFQYAFGAQPALKPDAVAIHKTAVPPMLLPLHAIEEANYAPLEAKGKLDQFPQLVNLEQDFQKTAREKAAHKQQPIVAQPFIRQHVTLRPKAYEKNNENENHKDRKQERERRERFFDQSMAPVPLDLQSLLNFEDSTLSINSDSHAANAARDDLRDLDLDPIYVAKWDHDDNERIAGRAAASAMDRDAKRTAEGQDFDSIKDMIALARSDAAVSAACRRMAHARIAKGMDFENADQAWVLDSDEMLRFMASKDKNDNQKDAKYAAEDSRNWSDDDSSNTQSLAEVLSAADLLDGPELTDIATLVGVEFPFAEPEETLKICKTYPDSYVAIVWPNARGFDEEIIDLFNQQGKVLCEHEVELTNDNIRELLVMAHTNPLREKPSAAAWEAHFRPYLFDESAWGSRQKAARIFVVIFKDLATQRACKQKIRALFKMSYNSIHINDTHKETIDFAHYFFGTKQGSTQPELMDVHT